MKNHGVPNKHGSFDDDGVHLGRGRKFLGFSAGVERETGPSVSPLNHEFMSTFIIF